MASFRGELWFCSNFYPATVEIDGVVYPTSEHAYVALKCANLEDIMSVQLCATPAEAKRFGQRAAIRPDWREVKVDVMRRILRAKFTQHPELAAKLLATGSRKLEEINEWGDRFWGISGGVGENWLGRIVMEIRVELGGAEALVGWLGIVLVTGGRTFGEHERDKPADLVAREREFVFAALDRIHKDRGVSLVLHGACTAKGTNGQVRGADGWSEHWAKKHEVNYLGVPAKWGKYGTSAGMRRNEEMLLLPFKLTPDCAIVFPGGVGTRGMRFLCQQNQIPVWEPRWTE